MIIRGGENIYPKEVEDVLAEHPDILEAEVRPQAFKFLKLFVYFKETKMCTISHITRLWLRYMDERFCDISVI